MSGERGIPVLQGREDVNVDQHKRLRMLALTEDLTMSDLLRAAVDGMLDDKKFRKKVLARARRDRE